MTVIKKLHSCHILLLVFLLSGASMPTPALAQQEDEQCWRILEAHLLEKYELADQNTLIEEMTKVLRHVKGLRSMQIPDTVSVPTDIHKGLLKRYTEVLLSYKLYRLHVQEIIKKSLNTDPPNNFYSQHILYLFYLFSDRPTVEKWRSCEGTNDDYTGTDLVISPVDEKLFSVFLSLREKDQTRPVYIEKVEFFPGYLRSLGPKVLVDRAEVQNFIGLEEGFKRPAGEAVFFRVKLNTGKVLEAKLERSNPRPFSLKTDLWGEWEVVAARHSPGANAVLDKIIWEGNWPEEAFIGQTWTFQRKKKYEWDDEMLNTFERRFKIVKSEHENANGLVFDIERNFDLKTQYVVFDRNIEKFTYSNDTLVIKGNKNIYEYKLVKRN